MSNQLSRRAIMAGAAALGAATPGISWAFERDGNRKVLVFSGNQQVPVLDPHVRYDWSTRMIQQGVYDGLLKYDGLRRVRQPLHPESDIRVRPGFETPLERLREFSQARLIALKKFAISGQRIRL